MNTRWTIIGLLIAALTHAQDPGESEWIMQELIEKDQSGDAEELYAEITSNIEQPVDLNNCSREELAETGIFTPFQVFAIMDQRERYGPFFSLYELAAIPGISREFLEQVRLMITFSGEKTPVSSRRADGMLLTNIAGRLPLAAGMHNSGSETAVYLGGPLKFTQRIRLDVGKQMSLGAAFEKDPGEAWTNRKRPEHFTGYLAYSPGNFVEQLLIGNFRIHRGMGLLHRLGFSARTSVNTVNSYRRSYAKPFASTLEYDYFRGMYVAAAKGKWQFDMFLSHAPADISFFRIEDKEDLFEMTRQTGMHRTAGESRGFDLARCSSAGGSLNRSGKHFYAGCSFTGALMKLTRHGTDSLYHTDALKSANPDSQRPGDRLKSSRSAASIYGVAFGTSYELFGEIAFDHRIQVAALLGGSLVINPAFSAEATFKRVSPGYLGVMPGTENSDGDEYDLGMALRITPFRYGRIFVYHDLKIAGRDARIHAPLLPEQYSSIECNWGKPNGPAFTFRYTGKATREINAGTRSATSTCQHNRHFRIQYKWEPVKTVILQGRIEMSTYSASVSEAIGSGGAPATVIYQQAQWIPRQGLRITYRYLLFDVDSWENRIYSYEPGVRYSFLFPSWTGKGSRNVLVFSVKAGRRITLRGKYGLTVYAHKWETGSGNDIREGNRLTDLEVQLQVDLF
jgi:hypothetical protein